MEDEIEMYCGKEVKSVSVIAVYIDSAKTKEKAEKLNREEHPHMYDDTYDDLDYDLTGKFYYVREVDLI